MDFIVFSVYIFTGHHSNNSKYFSIKGSIVKLGSHLRSRRRARSRRRRKHSVKMREVSEARVKYEASISEISTG